MHPTPDIEILLFRPEDQAAARALILAGLAERWGALDESRNPDLRDIGATFDAGIFLCVWRAGILIGTGGWVPRADGVVEIVRMSVAREARRSGIGRRIALALIAAARQRGARRVVLETTSTWADAVAFYIGLGFTETHRQDGDTYFGLDLVR